MADKNSSKNNFIMQAGILAAAGIISRIIGLLYRGPLQSVIGNLGLGYYQSAYNYYTIILLISSYSIPSAISKAIAQKLGEKEYRNAHRLFHGAMIYVRGWRYSQPFSVFRSGIIRVRSSGHSTAHLCTDDLRLWYPGSFTRVFSGT